MALSILQVKTILIYFQDEKSYTSSSHCFLMRVSFGTVEATTLNSRCYKLQPQDEFVRDNISKDDILIVSIGGNDIALAPAPCTIATLVGMTYCLPQKVIEKGFTCCSIPVSRTYILVN